jgi:hypothetical protein
MKLLLSRWALAHAFVPLLIVFVIIGLAPANAADASVSVVVPWGDWVRELLVSVGSIAVALVSWVIAKWAPSYVRAILTDAAVTNAVNYALTRVEGAVAGQQLEVHVASTVVAAAARYAVNSEPRVAKWLGDNLQPVILAKLSALGVAPAAAVVLPK